jgi:very-short-patch-repair endonuclease
MPSPETERARYLRNNMTKIERYVWSRLCSRQVAGYKFRRQHPIGPYVADFVCLSERLVVEVDGAGHEDEERDNRREAYIRALGFRVLRVPAQLVDEGLDDVMDGIYLALTEEVVPTRPRTLRERVRPPRTAGR